ncbi:MAG: TMEM165/GDT1 family protein [Candidatus Thiodiazotropha sp. (ex Monitilora ramsayi)]|nr:TMEM165/GDT1 family protein [Candidatus Thiodiazotropha sp. (ex Monitilora ramsayi)]
MLEPFSTLSSLVTSLVLIGLAEIGDKSQIVCMILASRYPGTPILLGAITAFSLLNLLAVVFGATVAAVVPDLVVALLVGALFVGFGIHTLRIPDSNEETVVTEKDGQSIFFTTFLLIATAEFGDKTQIAVAGLGSTIEPVTVWIGATMALGGISAIGIIAGKTLLQKIPLTLLHSISGWLFIGLGLTAWSGLYWHTP